MSKATLSNVSDLRLGRSGRRIVVDCCHGTTRGWLGGDGPHPISVDDIIRLLLARHADEQPACRCIAALWKEYFGCPLGEIVLVRGGS
jgi:hypothetical protein